MLRALRAAVFIVASFSPMVGSAIACTPIRIEGDFSRGGLVQQMVAGAATIQVMRATRRGFAWRYQYDSFPEVYAFDFEPVETLKGWDLGPLRLHGYARGAQEFDWAGVNEHIKARIDGIERRWENQDIVEIFQSYIEPTPSADSVACRIPYAFEVNQTYLVFRDQHGELITGAIRGTPLTGGGRREGPAIMAVNGRFDRWLRDVRAEVSRSW